MQTVNTTSTSSNAAGASVQATSNATRVYSDPKHAPMPAAGERIITARFRNPSRSATVIIQNTAWTAMQAVVPSTYAPLLAAVLETAAKTILARRLENMSVWPTEIDGSIFSADAIFSEASGANSDWLTKDELEAAWASSATRARFVSSQQYKDSKAYRAAVAGYQELIVKLAGKTSQYTEPQLDTMLAKLDPADLETELGAFIIRRVEQIKNRPNKEAVSFDLL